MSYIFSKHYVIENTKYFQPKRDFGGTEKYVIHTGNNLSHFEYIYI